MQCRHRSKSNGSRKQNPSETRVIDVTPDEKQQSYERAEELLAEQDFKAAAVAGAVAMLLAAIAYGIVTALWNYSYGFAAAGVGIFVGLAMQFVGRGLERKFEVLAAIYTVAGCILGIVWSDVMVTAISTHTPPFKVLQSASVAELFKGALAEFSLLHLVYWFVAIYAAGFCVTRGLSRTDRNALSMYEMQQ